MVFGLEPYEAIQVASTIFSYTYCHWRLRAVMKKWITIISVLATTALPCLAKLPLDVSLPKDAKLGQKVTVKVKTSPELKCKIEAQDAGVTQALKLLEQKQTRLVMQRGLSKFPRISKPMKCRSL